MTIEELINRAKLALKIKDYDQAIKLLNQIKKKEPDYPGIYVLLGFAYQIQKMYNKSIEYYNLSIKNNNNNIDAYNNLGIIYKDLQDYPQAIHNLEEALKINPKRADIYYNLGNVFKAINKLPEALYNFNKALEIKPDYSVVYNNIGIINEQMGNVDEAINIYQKGLKIDPNNPKLHYNLGIVYEHNNDLPKAADEYKKSTQINPNIIESQNNLGVIYLKLNQLEEAEKCFNNCLDFDPNYVKAINNLALVNEKEGNYKKAIVNYKKALSINQDYVLAKVNLGRTYANDNAPQKGKKILSEVLKENPSNLEAYQNLINIELGLNNKDNAVKLYNELLKLDPDNVKLKNELADIYTSIGKPTEAIHLYKKALNIKPDDIDNILKLSELYDQTDNDREAVELLEKTLEKHPNHPDLMLKLADFYIKNKNYENALKILNKIDRNIDNDSKLKFNYARVYKNLGDIQKAIQLMEELLTEELFNDTKKAAIKKETDHDISLFKKLLEMHEEAIKEYDKNNNEQSKIIRDKLHEIDFKQFLKELQASYESLEKKNKDDLGLEEIQMQIESDSPESIPIMNIGDTEPIYDIDEEEENISLKEPEERFEPTDSDTASDDNEWNEPISNSLFNLLKDQDTYADRIYSNPDNRNQNQHTDDGLAQMESTMNQPSINSTLFPPSFFNRYQNSQASDNFREDEISETQAPAEMPPDNRKQKNTGANQFPQQQSVPPLYNQPRPQRYPSNRYPPPPVQDDYPDDIDTPPDYYPDHQPNYPRHPHKKRPKSYNPPRRPDHNLQDLDYNPYEDLPDSSSYPDERMDRSESPQNFSAPSDQQLTSPPDNPVLNRINKKLNQLADMFRGFTGSPRYPSHHDQSYDDNERYQEDFSEANDASSSPETDHAGKAKNKKERPSPRRRRSKSNQSPQNTSQSPKELKNDEANYDRTQTGSFVYEQEDDVEKDNKSQVLEPAVSDSEVIELEEVPDDFIDANQNFTMAEDSTHKPSEQNLQGMNNIPEFENNIGKNQRDDISYNQQGELISGNNQPYNFKPIVSDQINQSGIPLHIKPTTDQLMNGAYQPGQYLDQGDIPIYTDKAFGVTDENDQLQISEEIEEIPEIQDSDASDIGIGRRGKKQKPGKMKKQMSDRNKSNKTKPTNDFYDTETDLIPEIDENDQLNINEEPEDINDDLPMSEPGTKFMSDKNDQTDFNPLSSTAESDMRQDKATDDDLIMPISDEQYSSSNNTDQSDRKQDRQADNTNRFDNQKKASGLSQQSDDDNSLFNYFKDKPIADEDDTDTLDLDSSVEKEPQKVKNDKLSDQLNQNEIPQEPSVSGSQNESEQNEEDLFDYLKDTLNDNDDLEITEEKEEVDLPDSADQAVDFENEFEKDSSAPTSSEKSFSKPQTDKELNDFEKDVKDDFLSEDLDEEINLSIFPPADLENLEQFENLYKSHLQEEIEDPFISDEINDKLISNKPEIIPEHHVEDESRALTSSTSKKPKNFVTNDETQSLISEQTVKVITKIIKGKKIDVFY